MAPSTHSPVKYAPANLKNAKITLSSHYGVSIFGPQGHNMVPTLTPGFATALKSSSEKSIAWRREV